MTLQNDTIIYSETLVIKNKMKEWEQLKHQVSLMADELDKLSRVI